MTRTLQELRDLIDATDKELLALLNRRAGFAAEVGEIKKLDGSPVYRPEREAQVIHGLQQAQTMFDKHPSRSRGGQAARMPLEQRFAQSVFQFAKAAAGGGQGQMCFACRCTQAAGLLAGHR